MVCEDVNHMGNRGPEAGTNRITTISGVIAMYPGDRQTRATWIRIEG
jgi:hypothetical protein